MRILVVIAFYPPQHVGGYELGCRDVVNELRQRGHDVEVLTSTFRHPGNEQPDERQVRRELERRSASTNFSSRLEVWKFVRTVRRCRPSLVYFWGISELCYWMDIAARSMGLPTVFFLSDTSFNYWRIGAWVARASRSRPKLAARFGSTFLVRGWPIVENRPCHFASAFLQRTAYDNEIRVDEKFSSVIHWGLNPSLFPSSDEEHWPIRRLLYVGQVIPQKGVHTAISALASLVASSDGADLTLTIVGGGMDSAYESQLRDLTVQMGITDRVLFAGKIARSELPRMYATHDLLIFPSEWEEPFAITPLEAMASKVAVVGTITGGSGEIFRDRETAMVFKTADATDCARAVRELRSDRVLFDRMRDRARSEVHTQHTLAAMVDKIEGSLKEIAVSQ